MPHAQEESPSSQRALHDAQRALDRWEPWLGALVAPAAGASAAPGEGAALAGVVFGVKELAAVRGLPRRCGAPDLVPAQPQPADAVIVAALRAAGAAVLGTTATHQWAYGIITPQTRNPRVPGRVAGGSSGGSAAVVAAGLAQIALGTDTGGSVRIPAACCGVVGVKPTLGSLPLDGVVALAPSLDTAGVLARDVDEAARALAVLLGKPGLSAAAPGAPEPEPLRFGVPTSTWSQRLDPEVRDEWQRLLRALDGSGCTTAHVALPSLPEAPRANGTILAVEALEQHCERLAAHPHGWWPDVRERLESARLLDTGRIEAARQVQARLRAELDAAFAGVDVLLTPTLACRVPRAGATHIEIDGVDEAVTPALTRLTNPWNLAGVPAGSVPVGRDRNGAPIGMQVIGPAGREDLVLAALRRIEALAGGPWAPAPEPGLGNAR